MKSVRKHVQRLGWHLMGLHVRGTRRFHIYGLGRWMYLWGNYQDPAV